MTDITIGKHDLIDMFFLTQIFQSIFINNGDAVGIVLAGKRRRIAAAGNLRDLGGSEGDDTAVRVVAVDHVEIMKIAPGCTHNYDAI